MKLSAFTTTGYCALAILLTACGSSPSSEGTAGTAGSGGAAGVGGGAGSGGAAGSGAAGGAAEVVELNP